MYYLPPRFIDFHPCVLETFGKLKTYEKVKNGDNLKTTVENLKRFYSF